MKYAVCGFVSGFVFGAGLLVSQMSNPAKVTNFLDVTRAWDPSLAFVMVGAVAVFALAYRLSLWYGRPLLVKDFSKPLAQGLSGRLFVGASIFGVGWGLSGFCPGPAIVSAAFGDPRVWTFIASMIAGILLYGRFRRR